MINPILRSVISALTALIASITGPLITLYVARAQIEAMVRSANWQKWIDKFREMIAQFCAEIAICAQRVIRDGGVALSIEPKIVHHFERAVFTANKIRLMVNPLEREHQDLLAVVSSLLARFRTAPVSDDLQDEGMTIVGQIVDMSLVILRREWLRVQRGA